MADAALEREAWCYLLAVHVDGLADAPEAYLVDVDVDVDGAAWPLAKRRYASSCRTATQVARAQVDLGLFLGDDRAARPCLRCLELRLALELHA